MSGSGRLQSADVALCLTGPEQAPGELLEVTEDPWGNVYVSTHLTDSNTLADLLVQQPSVVYLRIVGERRELPQAIDMRTDRVSSGEPTSKTGVIAPWIHV